MSAHSEDSFLTPVRPPLRLTVKYLPPSRSNQENRHWAQVMHEKRKALSALLSALHDAAHDSSTETTYMPVLKTCSMALSLHILSSTTRKRTSTSKFRSEKPSPRSSHMC